MIRALISFVFVMSVLVASTAHATTAANVFEQLVLETSSSSSDLGCSNAQAILNQSDFISCLLEPHQSRSAPRCHVDFASVVGGFMFLNRNCFSAMHVFDPNVPVDWLSKPRLGPPRIA